MSVVTDIADSVVAELSAATLNQPVTAERLFVPNFELSDMQTLHVSVVPKGMTVSKADRTRNTHDVQIDIGVQKKFGSGSPAEIDPLLDLVEEIADYFRLRRLSSYPNAHWIGTEHTPIYSPEHWDQMRQFTSVITFTFRVVR